MTKLGRLMVEFPLPPNLTRALLKAAALGCEDVMLPVAAMLSVENIFIRPGNRVCNHFTVGNVLQLYACLHVSAPKLHCKISSRSIMMEFLFLVDFVGKPDGQKEAEIRHKEIAACAGGSNDFLMLLCVFEKCRAR